jgi:6-pyruvoyltetrahydropterin/6-carboxytetrahydropterin synthase
VELELVGSDPELLDFALLKQALQAQCDAWTERLLLPGESPALILVRESDGETEFRLCGQRYVVPAGDVIVLPVRNVVVESLARVFAHALVARLGPLLRPELVSALSVTIAESPGQGATFRVELGTP